MLQSKSPFEYRQYKHRLIGGVSLYPLTALALTACGGGGDSAALPRAVRPDTTGDENEPVITITGEQTELDEGTIGTIGGDNTPTGYTVTATDPDDDAITFSVDDARFVVASDGSLNIVAGSVFDFETEPTITLTITATDNSAEALTDAQPVTIEITDVSGDPVLTVTGDLTLDEGTIGTIGGDNTPTGVTISATAEGGVTVALSDSRFNIADDGTLNIVAGSVFDFETEPNITLTITATDSANRLTTVQTIEVTVVDVPGDPTIADDTGSQTLTLGEGSIAFNTPTGYRFTATDDDGDNVVFTVTGDDRFAIADDGTLNIVGGSVFDYEDAANPEGVITLTITATDDSDDALTTTQTVEINIKNAPYSTALTSIDVPATDPATETDGEATPAFGDVDGDGDMDLLIGADDGKLYFYRWDGFDTGWVETTLDTTLTAPLNTDFDTDAIPTFYDIDGDGDDDLLVGDTSSRGLDYFRWGAANGTGIGWTAQTLPAPLDGDILDSFPGLDDSQAKAAFGDVDGDGDDDFLVGGASSGLIFYRWGAADGTGTGWTLQTDDDQTALGLTASTPNIFITPVFGDIDGDGEDDLLIGNAHGLRYFRYDGTGGVWTAQSLPSMLSEAATATDEDPAPAFGDVDGDGDIDLVVGKEDGTLDIYYWDDVANAWSTTTDVVAEQAPTAPVIMLTGTPISLNSSTFTDTTATGYTIAITDLNGDDITVTLSDDRFSIADDGTLNVVAGSVFDFEAEPTTFTLTITATDDSVNTLANTQDVTFDMGITVGSHAAPVFVNVDGDNDMDLLIGDGDGMLTFYRWGTATDTDADPGSRWAAVDLTGNLEPLAADVGTRATPAVGDVDGDGDMDLLVGKGAEEGGLTYYRWGTDADTVATSGSGWTAQTPPGDLDGAGYFNIVGRNTGTNITPAFGDVDGDDDIDLVVGRGFGNLNFFRWGTDADTVATLGRGWDGQAQSENPFNAPNANQGFDVGTYTTPTFGDVDGDGDMDILVGEEDGGLYFFRWGDGSGTEVAEADRATGWSRQDAANPFAGVDVGDNSAPTFGDIDGDGDMDLVVGNAQGTLSIWYWDGEPGAEVWTVAADLV